MDGEKEGRGDGGRDMVGSTRQGGVARGRMESRFGTGTRRNSMGCDRTRKGRKSEGNGRGRAVHDKSRDGMGRKVCLQ